MMPAAFQHGNLGLIEFALLLIVGVFFSLYAYHYYFLHIYQIFYSLQVWKLPNLGALLNCLHMAQYRR